MKNQTDNRNWVAIAIIEEDRLNLTPLETETYNEYYDGYYSDLTACITELQYEIHGEIVEVLPTQRRSYLGAIFAHIFSWKQ